MPSWQWKIEETHKVIGCNIRPLSGDEVNEYLLSQGIYEECQKVPVSQQWYTTWPDYGDPPVDVSDIERIREVWNLSEHPDRALRVQLILDTLRSAGDQHHNGFRHEMAFVRLRPPLPPVSDLHVDIDIAASNQLNKFLDRHETCLKSVHDEGDLLSIYLSRKAESQIKELGLPNDIVLDREDKILAAYYTQIGQERLGKRGREGATGLQYKGSSILTALK